MHVQKIPPVVADYPQLTRHAVDHTVMVRKPTGSFQREVLPFFNDYRPERQFQTLPLSIGNSSDAVSPVLTD